MSHWAYCPQCKEGMGLPTVVDAIIGKMKCPNCSNEDAYTMDDWERRNFLQPLMKDENGNQEI